ncbi:hypothetical protein EDC04DRAFT_1497204 [Pisolithus marmoratus]|nr:hypothetical protein EDC04DRAFT_1497204 [Pisolithus marmoratus]
MGGLTFNFHGSSTYDGLGDKISRVVSELCHLDLIRSYLTDWEVLSSLTQAKALRRLWLFLPRLLGRAPECPSGSIFPQLRTLDIWAASHTSCTDLFRWTSLNQVTEIWIYCEQAREDGYSPQVLVDMSSLISSQCKHLELCWFWSDFLPIPFHDASPSWPRPMLEPYQVYHQLRVIALGTRYSVTMSDDDFEDMVKAWPDLEAFHLFHDDRVDTPVHLTLRGVTALLHHCPKLKHFTLTFDATRVPEHVAGLSHETIVRNTAVQYMGVHTSPVSESKGVAAYLSAMMPSLEIIGIETNLGDIYGLEWLWIATQHQQKLVVRVDMSPQKLYLLLTAGTESASNHLTYDGEWYLKYRGPSEGEVL